MPHTSPLTAEGIVLNRQRTGENFLHLVFLSPETGIFHAGKRAGTTGSKSPQPDLFDEATLTFDPPRKGTSSLRFIREYRVVRRHERLGTDYATLALACRYARVLTDNPLPDTSAPHLHATLHRALTAWEAGRAPETVYFKALFLFARDEGFPVKEEWMDSLTSGDRGAVSEILRLPAQEIHAETHTSRLIRLFEKYLHHEHEVRFAESAPAPPAPKKLP